MKTGAWYVAGFVIAFVYFYVYAVNYIRGVRAEDIELDPVTNIQDFHQRLRRQSGKFVYKEKFVYIFCHQYFTKFVSLFVYFH